MMQTITNENTPTAAPTAIGATNKTPSTYGKQRLQNAPKGRVLQGLCGAY